MRAGIPPGFGQTMPAQVEVRGAEMSAKRNRKTSARGKRRAALTRARQPRTRLSLFSGRSSKTARRRRRTKSTRRTGLWRFVGRTAYWGTVCAIWALLIFGSLTAYYVSMLPDPLLTDLQKRPPNVTILAADGTIMAERGMLRGHVRLNRLPPYLVNAVLATEDRRFRNHWGVDPVGLARALWRNYHAGAVVEGGSTITQQLAKNLFLTPARTLERKLQEMVLAVWLEIRFSKNEILELYLNRVYFGAGTYGVEGASRRYFGKSARGVSLPEAALLAGLLKAPSRFAPTRNPRRAEKRASVVIANMVEAGLLSPPRAMAALAEPARVRNPSGLTGYEYAVDRVAEQLPDLIADRRSDLIVETTIDARLQRKAQQIVALSIASNGGFVNAGQAAAVVLDRRGGVRAMVGGTSYKSSQFNRAVKALRQPGSAFKPFVFLAALESGLTPDSLIEDAPVSINGWRPRNHNDSYTGQVTLRDALARSVNTVAVRLTMEVGRWRVIRTARRLGIGTRLHDRPSIALGTAEVTLLDLTASYAPFANGGQGVVPHIIRRVRTGSGKTLFQRRKRGPRQVVALSHVGAMNNMMAETLISGTGKRAALAGRPAGGKTGTSQNFRDAWFVGYTARYVGGIWVGNDEGTPMKRVTGGGLPAEIWKQVMTEAHKDLPVAALPGRWTPAVAQRNRRVPQQVQPTAPAARIDDPFLRRVLGALRPND